MAVTRLKRKGLRNKANAKKRNERIKKLTTQPPIKQVDVEAMKAEFDQKGSKPKATKADKKSAAKSKAKAEPDKEEAPVKKDAAQDVVEQDTSAEKKEAAKGQVEDTATPEEPKKEDEGEQKK
jgi:hypothetical protein